MTRYATLAAILSQRIQQGLYPAGHRLPSVRALSQEHGVSISTVQQAYRLLEEQRLVEARRSRATSCIRGARRPSCPP